MGGRKARKEHVINISRHARRVRLWPSLDALEDKCLLSSGTLGELPRATVEVHTLNADQAKHTPKPDAHAHKTSTPPSPMSMPTRPRTPPSPMSMPKTLTRGIRRLHCLSG